jgi:hypothetical protein
LRFAEMGPPSQQPPNSSASQQPGNQPIFNIIPNIIPNIPQQQALQTGNQNPNEHQQNPNQNQHNVLNQSPLAQLQNNINRLNFPLEQLPQNASMRDQTLLYLRRLQSEMLRFVPQLNRGIQLLQEGRITHLNEFVPVFHSLNLANTVAVEAIQRLNSQGQEQQGHHHHHHRHHNHPQHNSNQAANNNSANNPSSPPTNV